MLKFNSISKEKEFLALDAKRLAILGQLSGLKKALETSRQKPSLRSFQRIEAKVDNQLDQLATASMATSAYFAKAGGDPLNDPGFQSYCDTETNIMGELQILRESYNDILKSKGMLQPAADPVSLTELVSAMKTLAESSQRHAAAALHHHKLPTMNMPIFDPSKCRGNILGWRNFWQKFELFTIDCIDNRSRMGFLLSCVRNDAYNIIRNLKCTEENFLVAKELLEGHYNKADTIKEQILLSCLKFRFPKPNLDLSNFVSSIINL